MSKTPIKSAFVSTNSVSQGEQVAAIWKPLVERFNIHIDFAWHTFRWNSESLDQAAVHCVIIGFSCVNDIHKKSIYVNNNVVRDVISINPYLLQGDTLFVERRTTPLCNVPKCTRGNQPTDGGNLIIEEIDYEEFIKNEPAAVKFIKNLMGAYEFINRKNRYCLWLVNATPSDIQSMPFVLERIKKVRDMRLESGFGPTRELANRPTQFRETWNPDAYVVIPRVSSERRRYVPMGFLDKDTIPTDSVIIIPEASIYHFGILTSNVHMAWMRVVAGRLKSDYRYSKDIVYNNFPWPNPTEAQKTKIEATAQAILDARALYPDSSLAALYDELTMPPELRKAHQNNDRAVMEAYGFDWRNMSESDCVAELMKLYQQLVSKE